MDFVSLLKHVPALLEACIKHFGDFSLQRSLNIQTLRLVSKESSIYALSAVKVFSLTLKGHPGDTNVGGTRLLQHTRLNELRLELCLSAVMVNAFLQEVGAALSTVTKIDMSYDNTGGSTFTTAILNNSVAQLVHACPSLVTLDSVEHVSLQLFRLLGEACPTLNELCMREFGLHASPSTLHSILPELPIVFPHLQVLDLPSLSDQMHSMTHIKSLRSLLISSLAFVTEAQWLLLPPALQTLHIDRLEVGPPSPNTGTHTDSPVIHLLHVDVIRARMPLHAVAQLLRAAPALRDLEVGFMYVGDNDEERHPFVEFTESLTTAADLGVMRDRSSLLSIKTVVYCFSGLNYLSAGALQPMLNTLPRMTGSTSCTFADCSPSVLTQLLNMFPDVCDLVLGGDIDDLQLQSLVACAQLKRLKLHGCNNMGPVGLACLCMRLPGLCHVRCEGCNELHALDLEECKIPLMRDILMIERDLSKGILCGDWS